MEKDSTGEAMNDVERIPIPLRTEVLMMVDISVRPIPHPIAISTK